MKILHVVSGDSGGAYQAAVGLNELLIEHGFNSRLLTSKHRSTRRKFVSKMYTLINRLLTRKAFGIMSIKSYDGILSEELSRIRPDVIHVHNWFNMLSVEKLSKISKIAPTVITMHDERLMTGGCHNHLDCAQINNSCADCPASTLTINKFIMHNRVVSNEILKNKKNEIVVPSEWMRNRIQEYVGSATKVSIIPNPVHKIFHSQAKTTETDIKSREFKIGFVAADPWVPLKGLIGLLESLSEVKSITEEKLSLEIVGKIRKSSSLPKFATAVGIKKNAELVKFLDTIDFLVVPSLSENLPNIITEAQLRGTVVVATRVGGIPEMITDEYDGFLQQSDESLTSLLLRVIEKNPSFLASVSFQARTVSSIRNSREKIFKDYQTVYLKAISNE